MSAADFYEEIRNASRSSRGHAASGKRSICDGHLSTRQLSSKGTFLRNVERVSRNEPAGGEARSSLGPLDRRGAVPRARRAGSAQAGPDPPTWASPLARPSLLDRPIDAGSAEGSSLLPFRSSEHFQIPMDPPIGFTGPSGVLPTDFQESDHFVPVEDRWRLGYPAWDRYGKGHPITDDYPYSAGRWFDPYNQNVFKGDYPIIGQHTFLDITTVANLDFEGRQLPTQTTPFESTERPFSGNFFGRPNSFFTLNFFSLSFDLFHGDAAFKPVDWRIKLTPTLGVSNFSFSELAQTSPNVLQGTARTREVWALQEAFVEYKLADLGPDYDFVSVRAGTQPFNADFRGFLFADINRGIRLFGTQFSNRDQFNLVYFRQWEKDTNTGLNTFNDRRQNLFFANYYRQDFIFPGYTAQVSLNYDNDPASIKYDKNRFLVRPDADGSFSAAHGQRGLLRLGGRWALGQVQPDPPVLLGVRL